MPGSPADSGALGSSRVRIIHNWMLRHQNRTSFWLHMVGIPMTIVAVGLAVAGHWDWFAGLFLLGYGLQFIGHAIEGNDAGELILIKKALGMKYIDIAPGSPRTE